MSKIVARKYSYRDLYPLGGHGNYDPEARKSMRRRRKQWKRERDDR